jgi:cell division septum initiation protein DivIVA
MIRLKKSITGRYKAADVDNLLIKVRNDYEKCLKEQKNRIITLREENKELKETVGEYKNNERCIITAITKAEETAQSILREAEQKAQTIIEGAHAEEEQIKTEVKECYQRLCKLKRASEAILRAVSTVMGDHEETDKKPVQYGLRPVMPFPAAQITE